MLAKILCQRLVQAVFVAYTIGSLTFLLVRALPGDIAYKVAAGRYGEDAVSTSAAAMVRSELGLQQPVFQQYISWLTDLAQFNLGNSLVSGNPVIEELQYQMGYSAILAICAILLAYVIAAPIGLLRAKYANKMFDQAALLVSVFLRAQPIFCLGLLLTILLSVELKWLPAAGFGSIEYIILPSITLALSLAAISSQIIRDETLKSMQSEYYQFAQIKGLKNPQLLLRHVLPNIGVPIVSYMGIQFIGLIEGVIMIESLFAWPGIGHALSHAVFARDIPMLQGSALVLGLAFVLINTLVDLTCYQWDPRGGRY